MKNLFATICLSACFCVSAFSSPLSSTRGLPEDGTCLVHLDADAFRASESGKTLLRELTKKSDKDDAGKISKILDMISGITASQTKDGNAFVALVNGKFDKAALLEYAKAECTLQEVKIGNRTAYKLSNIDTSKVDDLGLVYNSEIIFVFLSDSEIIVVNTDSKTEMKVLEKALKDYDADKSMPVPAAAKSVSGAPALIVYMDKNALSGSMLDTPGNNITEVFAYAGESKKQVSVNISATYASAEKAAEEKESLSTSVSSLALILSMKQSSDESGAGDKSTMALIRALAGTKFSVSGKILNARMMLPANELSELFTDDDSGAAKSVPAKK